MGLAYRLNQGIGLAKGKYIARMDDDDISHPNRLKYQLEFLEKNPFYDLIIKMLNYFENSSDRRITI